MRANHKQQNDKKSLATACIKNQSKHQIEILGNEIVVTNVSLSKIDAENVKADRLFEEAE